MLPQHQRTLPQIQWLQHHAQRPLGFEASHTGHEAREQDWLHTCLLHWHLLSWSHASQRRCFALALQANTLKIILCHCLWAACLAPYADCACNHILGLLHLLLLAQNGCKSKGYHRNVTTRATFFRSFCNSSPFTVKLRVVSGSSLKSKSIWQDTTHPHVCKVCQQVMKLFEWWLAFL